MNHLSDERGFALIAALWFVVLLSGLGLDYGLAAREQRLATANAAEAERAYAAALAGIEHARARLGRLLEERRALDGSASPSRVLDPWLRADTVLTEVVLLDDAGYRVQIQDAGARLNLNLATETELRRFFTALGVDGGRADRIAQAILDWRDPDDLRRARGAERGDYLRDPHALLPRNAPFAAVSELREVRGVGPEVYGLAEPHLTLAGNGQVNLTTASRPVLLALPGMSEELVALLLRDRAAGVRTGSLYELVPRLSAGARAALQAELPRLFRRTTTETRMLEVRSTGFVDGSAVRVEVRSLLVRGGYQAIPLSTVRG